MTLPPEYTGSFGGFVFTDEGKRRMLLRQAGRDLLLKVPRILRRRIIGKFRAGESIRVAVTEERHPDTGVLKQIVSQVLPDVPDAAADPVSPAPLSAPAVSCVVRVCAKKNCWRNGGRELYEALKRDVDATGQSAHVEIQQVGCLDRCKHAPNVDAGRWEYARCSPRDAGTILAQALASHAKPL